MLCSVLPDAALRCLMAIKNVERAMEYLFCLSGCCALLGEVLELVDYSFELTRLQNAQLMLFTFNLAPTFRILCGTVQKLRKV